MLINFNNSNNGKDLLAGLGLLALTSAPLSLDLNAQNEFISRVGAACDIINLKDFSHTSLGFESSLEKSVNGMKNLSCEFLMGFYADLPKSENSYSKIQGNLGLKYHPVLENGWYIGVKAAVGIASELYNSPKHPMGEEKRYTKFLALDIEKMFNKRNGINLSVSREMDRKVWIISAKWVPKGKPRVHQRKNQYVPPPLPMIF